MATDQSSNSSYRFSLLKSLWTLSVQISPKLASFSSKLLQTEYVMIRRQEGEHRWELRGLFDQKGGGECLTGVNQVRPQTCKVLGPSEPEGHPKPTPCSG